MVSSWNCIQLETKWIFRLNKFVNLYNQNDGNRRPEYTLINEIYQAKEKIPHLSYRLDRTAADIRVLFPSSLFAYNITISNHGQPVKLSCVLAARLLFAFYPSRLWEWHLACFFAFRTVSVCGIIRPYLSNAYKKPYGKYIFNFV